MEDIDKVINRILKEGVCRLDVCLLLTCTRLMDDDDIVDKIDELIEDWWTITTD